MLQPRRHGLEEQDAPVQQSRQPVDAPRRIRQHRVRDDEADQLPVLGEAGPADAVQRQSVHEEIVAAARQVAQQHRMMSAHEAGAVHPSAESAGLGRQRPLVQAGEGERILLRVGMPAGQFRRTSQGLDQPAGEPDRRRLVLGRRLRQHVLGGTQHLLGALHHDRPLQEYAFALRHQRVQDAVHAQVLEQEAVEPLQPLRHQAVLTGELRRLREREIQVPRQHVLQESARVRRAERRMRHPAGGDGEKAQLAEALQRREVAAGHQRIAHQGRLELLRLVPVAPHEQPRAVEARRVAVQRLDALCGVQELAGDG